MAYFKSNPDKILLHGRDSAKYDAKANSAISPGQCLVVSGTEGEYPLVDAGQAKTLRVAKEYSHTGMTIDDSYAAGDHMEYYHLMTGEVAYLPLAAGEAVTEDDELVVDTNGNLRLLDTAGGDSEAQVVAYANEAVDNSGGSEPVKMAVTAR